MLTGGGDCPGINAVIRAVVLDAAAHGTEVVGVLDGFAGLMENRTRLLSRGDVTGILHVGGSILGCSNRDNPSRVRTGTDASGRPLHEDRRRHCLDVIHHHGIEALVVIGGDGTMTCAQGLVDVDPGFRCVGIPKTIDNDIPGTEMTFGFLTAVETATEAIDRVQTTAASHHRVIVVEVMGRHAGWLALFAGLASGSHLIVIPEVPFSMEAVAEQVKRACEASATGHSVVCIAEGARQREGGQVSRLDPSLPDPVRLGGVGAVLASGLATMTGLDSRHVALGHIQRGGPPIAADRIIATQFGQHAMELVRAARWQRMVARQNFAITDVPLSQAASGQRLVPVDHPLIRAARGVGVGFGDAAKG